MMQKTLRYHYLKRTQTIVRMKANLTEYSWEIHTSTVIKIDLKTCLI